MGFGAPGSFNTGTDLILTITCPNLNIAPAVLKLDGRLERFTAKENAKVEKDAPCDNGGVIDSVRIPEDWTGTIEMVRQSDNFGAVIAALDAAFFSGQPDTPFTIQVQVPDRSGVTPTPPDAIYSFSNAKFRDYESGDYARGTKVKCSLTFDASLRTKIQ